MDSKTIYTSKAAKYARYRWDYAPAAVQALLDTAGVGPHSTIADIGAGTGILTRHLVHRAGQVIGVEPNAEMRTAAGAALPYRMVDASAEATSLPDRSVDLITVAQAIHWFDPLPARREFLRILKPNGWLAIISNESEPNAFTRAIDRICTPDNGVAHLSAARRPDPQPAAFFYGSGAFTRCVFPFAFEQDFEAFMGAMLSASYMPDESHPGYPKLEREARAVFERFAEQGQIWVRGETALVIGQPIFPGAER